LQIREPQTNDLTTSRKKMKQVFLIIVGDSAKGHEEDALIAKKPLS